jgi:hypothetical protein
MLDKPLPMNFPVKQWVCLTCGYNMIGEMPDVCPFCGARHDKFKTWEETEAAYTVTPLQVSDKVTQLMSRPRLGIEHAAYRIETIDGPVWVDSPSAFNRTLPPVGHIFFSHKDFLGASNQYRALWDCEIHLHEADAKNPLAALFPVDDRFTGDFAFGDLEAFHIGGHSPGWTLYIQGDVLFACDYAFPPGARMRLNPFGPQDPTRERARRIVEIVDRRKLSTVCGYHYVVDFGSWRRDFDGALTRAA